MEKRDSIASNVSRDVKLKENTQIGQKTLKRRKSNSELMKEEKLNQKKIYVSKKS